MAHAQMTEIETLKLRNRQLEDALVKRQERLEYVTRERDQATAALSDTRKTITEEIRQAYEDDRVRLQAEVNRLTEELAARVPYAGELAEVLTAMVGEHCDYMIRNKLGNPEHDHNIKWARRVLAKNGLEIRTPCCPTYPTCVVAPTCQVRENAISHIHALATEAGGLLFWSEERKDHVLNEELSDVVRLLCRESSLGQGPTPRTDAAIITGETDERLAGELVSADVARALERELTKWLRLGTALYRADLQREISACHSQVPVERRWRHDLDCAQREGNDCDCGFVPAQGPQT